MVCPLRYVLIAASALVAIALAIYDYKRPRQDVQTSGQNKSFQKASTLCQLVALPALLFNPELLKSYSLSAFLRQFLQMLTSELDASFY